MKNANLLSSGVVRWIGLLFAFAPVWLDAAEDTPTPPPAVRPASEYFIIRVGDKPLQLQLAVTEAEQRQGLMERRSLQPNEGMLFIYAKPGPMSFWMRNTPLALDVAFYDPSGVMREFYPLYPYDENTVRSRNDGLQFAIEMRQGWFRDNGVLPGSRIELRDVIIALRARGFDPAKFGLTL